MLISIPKLLSTDYHPKAQMKLLSPGSTARKHEIIFQLDPFLFQICSAVPTYKYLSIRRQEVDVIEPITRRSDGPLRQHNAYSNTYQRLDVYVYMYAYVCTYIRIRSCEALCLAAIFFRDCLPQMFTMSSTQHICALFGHSQHGGTGKK